MKKHLLFAIPIFIAIVLLIPSNAEAVESHGTIEVAVLMAQYDDYSFQELDNTGVEDLMFGSQNSMYDFFYENSGGDLNLQGDVFGPFTLPGDKCDYGENGNRDVFDDTIDEADPSVNFGPYDAFVVIHAGQGYESGGDSCAIWSHQRGGNWQTGEKTFYQSETFPEYQNCGGRASPLGVAVHEFGHMIDLDTDGDGDGDKFIPDLYSTDYSNDGIGAWGVMAGGSWNDCGETPAYFSAWVRYMADWLDDEGELVILTSGEEDLDIQPIYSNGVVYKLPIPASDPDSDEYFLIENRQKESYDSALPGDGLLIWHIDMSVCYQKWNSNSVQNDASHRCVAVEEADGNDELDTDGGAGGQSGDPWFGDRDFTNSSYPSSNSYDGEDSLWRLLNIKQVGSAINLDINMVGEPTAIISIDGTETDSNFPIKVIKGDDVYFDASSSVDQDGDDLSFDWDVCGTSLSQESFTLSFNSYQECDVYLTVEDTDDMTHTTSVSIFVHGRPTISYTITKTEVSMNEEITVDVSSSHDDEDGWEDVVDFWRYKNLDCGVISQNFDFSEITNWTFSYEEIGECSATLIVTDTWGAVSEVTIDILVRNEDPEVDFTITPESGNTSISFQFEDLSTDFETDYEDLTRTWDFGDGSSLTTTDSIVYHTYSMPDTYDIILIVEDEHDGSNTTTKQFTVDNSLPIAIIDIPNGISIDDGWTIPSGEGVLISAEGSTDHEGLSMEYSWSVNDENYDGATVNIALDSGTYSLKLTVTDYHGAQVSISRVIEVIDRPTTSLNVEFTNILVGDSLSITASNSTTTDIDSYSWTLNGGIIGTTIETIDFTPSEAGQYLITVTGHHSSGLTTDTHEITIAVYNPPVSRIDIAGLYVEGKTLLFDGSDSTGTDLSYSWNLDGQEYDTVSFSKIMETGGNHHITLTVTQNPIGESTSEETFYIDWLPTLEVTIDTDTPRVGETFVLHFLASDFEDVSASISHIAVSGFDNLGYSNGNLGDSSLSLSLYRDTAGVGEVTVTFHDSHGNTLQNIFEYSVSEWPDGEVGNMNWFGGDTEGDSGVVQVSVANRGAGGFEGKLYLTQNGRQVSEWDVVLSPSSDSTFSYEWTAEEGFHTFQAELITLDAINGRVGESDLTNNNAELTFEIQKKGLPSISLLVSVSLVVLVALFGSRKLIKA